MAGWQLETALRLGMGTCVHVPLLELGPLQALRMLHSVCEIIRVSVLCLEDCFLSVFCSHWILTLVPCELRGRFGDVILFGLSAPRFCWPFPPLIVISAVCMLTLTLVLLTGDAWHLCLPNSTTDVFYALSQIFQLLA